MITASNFSLTLYFDLGRCPTELINRYSTYASPHFRDNHVLKAVSYARDTIPTPKQPRHISNLLLAFPYLKPPSDFQLVLRNKTCWRADPVLFGLVDRRVPVPASVSPARPRIATPTTAPMIHPRYPQPANFPLEHHAQP